MNSVDVIAPEFTVVPAEPVASPVVIIEKWLSDSGLKYGSQDFNNYCVEQLNNPDNAFLRTGQGQLKKS